MAAPEYKANEERIIAELYNKADRGGYFTFTDFLGLSEQSALNELTAKFHPRSLTLFGGAEGAERIMVRFGNPEEIGYEEPFPIHCVKIEPLSQKFADKLTHRDFLGSLIALGIYREVLGDIVISADRAREQAAEYGHSEEREFAFLTAHGTLHLLGYDHEKSEEDEKLHFSRQEEILDGMGIGR